MKELPEAMTAITKFTRKLARDTRGTSAIEYALLATMVSTVLVMAAISLGTSVNDVTESSASEIDKVIAQIDGATPTGNGDTGAGTGSTAAAADSKGANGEGDHHDDD